MEPLIIAEIGCNHKGSIDIALNMIKKVATFCKADAAKFQKRTVTELLSEDEYNAPHPNPENAYGENYGLHRKFLELDIEQHALLKSACEEYGIIYSTSVWDLTAAKDMVGLNPQKYHQGAVFQLRQIVELRPRFQLNQMIQIPGKLV